MESMQGALMRFFSANHWLLVGDVQAEGQDPRPSVAVKHQVLIGLDRQDRQLLRSTQANDALESAAAQLGDTHLEANPFQGRAKAQSRIKSNLHSLIFSEKPLKDSFVVRIR